jgi:hypothetical protein
MPAVRVEGRNAMWDQVIGFFTNKGAAESKDAPIKAPALSITKVGVGAMFLWTLLSGLTGLIGPLNNSNPAVIEGAFGLAKLGLVVAGAISVADVAARGLPAVFAAARSARGSGEPPA